MAFCYHCGNDLVEAVHRLDEHSFCCSGCKSVYQILSKSGLCNYYRYNDHPGANRARVDKRYAYLDEPAIIKDLIDFQDDQVTTITFYVPYIHCSSCIWLLEQINKIDPAIYYSRVDFLKKRVQIRFDNREISLRKVVETMADIGYEPLISLQDVVKKQAGVNSNGLVKKIAVAGFCFGNVMLLSFPEYFGLSGSMQNFQYFFGWLNVLFAIPVLLYSGREYFTSAWNNLRNGVLNIDFPLALGIAVLFLRTVFEVSTHSGAGFADTLCGLVFFLLVGKFVQQKTYHHLSFERDYRSFFPVAVHTLVNGLEKPVPLSELKTGDRILIRNSEIIPADAILLKGKACIDFSFVTGEALPVARVLGEIVYAGGRQMGEALELEVIKPVSQSYLTQLWNNEAFTRKQDNRMGTFNQKVSKYFTYVLLLIAFASLIWWLPTNVNRAIAAFTAVLIVACPCALALSTPFTMSAALSVFDKNAFYLKNTAVVEQMARIDTIVFDKTGTITSPADQHVILYSKLDDASKQLIYSACNNSTHPLSRQICQFLGNIAPIEPSEYTEIAGQGISARINGHIVLIGNHKLIFHGQVDQDAGLFTKVHLKIDEYYAGYFSFKNQFRKGLDQLSELRKRYDIYLLSGDKDHELELLTRFFPDQNSMYFGRSPQEKLDLIRSLQAEGKIVMMIGDGLNDSGALKQSDLGIAITDNVNNFSPGSDAILDGSAFDKLSLFLRFSKDTVKIIHASFLISLCYNLFGLSFAVTGRLSPLMAAVLMPASTATIIAFTSIAAHIAAKKRRLL
ncbi:MAG: heavy metal translocating P-type ATPase metal-binding domain-containing protein [Mucilaginibacter sp.]|uniref:heavy metal translocating P-type ATPase n=1 Tax=Mucilaginibacter sp. TaxID=1882438 RepID=UPI0032640CF5